MWDMKRNNYYLSNLIVYIIGCNYLIIMISITLSKVIKHKFIFVYLSFFFLSSVFVFCLLVCLSTCLLVCLSACLLFCLSACLLVCLSACLLVYLSTCLLVCLSASLLLCLSICLLVCLSQVKISPSRCDVGSIINPKLKERSDKVQ